MSDDALIRLARRLDPAMRRYGTLTDLDCERINRRIDKALLMSPTSHAGYKAKKRIVLFLRAIGVTPDRVP